ncbi:PilT/PilU family type 4a pilus ATPase [Geomobilimonas luticola]|uniref:PilT/PilU family type 4a pilus ATPase n=1 Tax=Geomobilimonas luticola TaxID=1114878 RepID=A0ABS5SGZ8_9BACT|nr:PilT/PilU family type 4a pilus ATPase [Geomobilimonas luticola]MBT0654640.1 PilT/PilU family type 4a pilus ATPase [Geomobilimonas luticola]
MEQTGDKSAKPELKLGELLCQAGVISQEQLDQALNLQKQKGGRIGSLLLDLGVLTVPSLVAALKEKHQVNSADLYELEISPNVLGILPLEKMQQFQVLPIAVGPKSVFLAMADPSDVTAINELEFFFGRSVQPIVVPDTQLQAALRHLEKSPVNGKPLRGMELQRPAGSVAVTSATGGLPSLHDLCRMLVEEKGSDLLLSAGAPHTLKRHGQLVRLPHPALTPDQTAAYAREIMTPSQREEFERTNELDFAFTYPDICRFRANIYRQRSSVALAIRTIVEEIPTLAELGLPPWLGEFALRPHGLILVSGPTGNGKTTTLAALLDLINSHRQVNIVTIEEPIEYHHRHKKSNVNQREVGIDTDSFHEGLKRVFRQAPDVIVVGEMRDPASAAIAIQAAGTGHLVMTTLHAPTATATIERIIDIFAPNQQQLIRAQLAESLLLVLNQRLVPTKDGKGVVLAVEKLVNSSRVRSFIREGKTHQIRNMFQQGAEDFLPLDFTLAQLCREGKISQDEGLKLCENQNFFQEIAARRPGR